MKKEKKSATEKVVSLSLMKQEDVTGLKESPADESKNEKESLETDVGVTVAAFMLNADHQAADMGLGSENANSEAVRKEILKAIKEESETL